MPVTAGHVPGVTSGLRRIPMDPGRFHSGRWFLLIEGVLVTAFGTAGLVSAALHPHAGPTGAPVLGLATTPFHSAILVAFGVVAIAAVGNRHAAITVTASSAVGYLLLLFFSSVATARAKPTPLGFHAADIVLHAALGIVNLGLLMWFIPDELGDEVWGPRRGRGRGRRRSALAIAEPAPGSPSPASATKPGPPPAAAAPRARESGDRSSPPVSIAPAHPAVLDQSTSHETNESSTANVNSARRKHAATQTADAVLIHGFVPVVVVIVAAVVGVVIWMRRRVSEPVNW